jgi:hypothetical protein
MIMKSRILLISLLMFSIILLAACSAATPEQEAVSKTEMVEGEVEAPMDEEPAAEEPAVEEPAEAEPPVEEEPVAPTPQPTATQAAQPTAAPTISVAPATPLVEERLIEVEWPERLYLGDSDVVRMALIPSAVGYTLTTEFPDHTTTTQDVPIVRPEGYELLAVGRLDGVGFTISPAKEQISSLPLEQPVTWHWSLTPVQPGQQRLTISLLLRWDPLPDTVGIRREAVAYSKGLDVRVNSFFGMSRGQTLNTALVGLAVGGSLIFFAAIYRVPFGSRYAKKKIQMSDVGIPAQIREPNPALEIEIPAGLILNTEETILLQSLFQRYHRLLIQREFLSGYSGARTFLLIPIRADRRADAPTIAKLGAQADIEQEYQNYEAFVKRTLPPVTARIQAPPVKQKSGNLAALQYTFIGEPGTEPVSLRQVLLADPEPKLISRLFETFGPNWWMQRSPWTFRLAQEYDRLLPPHWIIEPDTGKGIALDGHTAPAQIKLSIGDLINPQAFTARESGGHRDHLTLRGKPSSGQPGLRLRWLANHFPRNAVGRVAASRMDLLRSYVVDFDLLGLPDPLEKLSTVLEETIQGTRTIIHGDLNPENVLIGPGGMVWLIDFASTREGHPLMDFAHLEAEVIAHVIAPQVSEGETFLRLLEAQGTGHKTQGTSRKSQNDTQPTIGDQPFEESFQALLATVHEIAFKCLANPSQAREYWLALYMSCLGALKFRNLNAHQKYFLYLTAAYLGSSL